MIRDKVEAVIAFFNSIASGKDLPAARSIRDASSILPHAFELLDNAHWKQAGTNGDVFDRTVAVLKANSLDEDFTNELDATAASSGDDEASMKILVATLYEIRLQQPRVLFELANGLLDPHQFELTHIISYLDSKEDWSATHGWAGVLYKAFIVQSSPVSTSNALSSSSSAPSYSSTPKSARCALPMRKPFAVSTGSSPQKRATRSMAVRYIVDGSDSPLKDHLNSPRALDKTLLKEQQKKILDLKSHVADLECMAQGYETDADHLREQVRELTTEKQMLTLRCENARHEAENANSLRQQVEELEQERNELSEQLHREKTRVVVCESDLERLRLSHNHELAEAEKAADALEAERTTVSFLRQKMADMTEELCDSNNKFEEAQRRLREIEEQARIEAEEREAIRQAQVESHRAALEAKQEEYFQLIDTNNCASQQYMDEINELRAALQAKAQEPDNASAEISRLEAALTDKSREAEDLGRKLEDRQAEVTTLSENLQQLTNTCTELKAECETHKTTAHALEVKLLEADHAKEALAADFEGRVAQQTAATEDAERRRSELADSLTKDLENTSEKLAASTKEHGEAWKKVEELSEEKRQLTDHIASLQKDLAELKEDPKENIAGMEDRLERMTQVHQEDVANAHLKYNELKNEKKKIEDELHLLKSKLLSSESEVATLSSSVEHSLAKSNDMEARLSTLQGEVEAAQKQLGDLIAARDAALDGNCELRDVNEKLCAEIQAANETIEGFKMRQKEALDKHSEVDRARRQVTEQNEELCRKLTKLEQQLQENLQREADVSDLTRQLRSYETDNAALRENLRSLAEEKAQLERQVTELTLDFDCQQEQLNFMTSQSRNINCNPNLRVTAQESIIVPGSLSGYRRDEGQEQLEEPIVLLEQSVGDRTMHLRPVTEAEEPVSTTPATFKLCASRHQTFVIRDVLSPNTMTTVNLSGGNVSPNSSCVARAEDLRERSRVVQSQSSSHSAIEPMPSELDLCVTNENRVSSASSVKRKGPLQRMMFSGIFKTKPKSTRQTPKKTPMKEPQTPKQKAPPQPSKADLIMDGASIVSTDSAFLQAGDRFIRTISAMIETVQWDRRDVWSSNAKSYVKDECLSMGNFGVVKLAECHDPAFSFTGPESRKCVIKTKYLRKLFDSVYENGSADSSSESTASGSMLARLARRTVMELFVLNRCRHENIMHAHAVSLTDGDLHIVLPRLYVLSGLIEMFRQAQNSEPIPVKIIAMIIRQLCRGLEYLQAVGIIHRDIQPENIHLTRGGTVKLGHFGQSRPLITTEDVATCKTPVGKEEFMCFEKLHNMYEIDGLDDCVSYSFSADIWSLGVLVLQMVSYFPNERFHRLATDFALIMQKESMPFHWLIADMIQLRARLVKSGGEELKMFVSERLLTVRADERPTPSDLLRSQELRKWCNEKLEDDKRYLRKKFIDEVDFSNQVKLENEGHNYDWLETKDIPVEFYLDDTWKTLEQSEFSVQLFPTTAEGSIVTSGQPLETTFKFSAPQPLFRFLHSACSRRFIKLTDMILIDHHINELTCELVRPDETAPKGARSLERVIRLPDTTSTSDRAVSVKVSQKLPEKRRRYSSSSTSSSSDDNN